MISFFGLNRGYYEEEVPVAFDDDPVKIILIMP